MLDHSISVSNNLVKHPFPGQINLNPVSYTSVSRTEISVFVIIDHAALHSSNTFDKLLDISESYSIVFTIYSFSLI